MSSTANKAFDLIVLGATGFTGRQAVLALVHRAATQPLRWAVAGRSEARLKGLVAELVPSATAQPGIVVADTQDPDSLQRLAAQTTVLLNLAGPYAQTGEAVVQACIAERTHYLDLAGETFWVQQLIARQHRAAELAKVKIIPCCGYEALPFDLATLWVAYQSRERVAEACREVKLVVGFNGRRITSVKDAISGGTVASLKSLLESDHSDCVRNPACLLPPDSPDAAAVAKRHAYRFVPQFDADVNAVTAPTVPAPFVNPPIVLRTQALLGDASLFTHDFHYVEALNMASLVPRASFLPPSSMLPLQWAAAASLSVPLAGLSATLAGPLQFQRQGLRKLVEWFAPDPGQGPSEEALTGTGYQFDIFATSASGKTLRGRMDAKGHPGYRSTPEMAVTAALGLARGTLGRTPHFGVVTPAAGLGIEAVPALREAGVTFSLLAWNG